MAFVVIRLIYVGFRCAEPKKNEGAGVQKAKMSVGLARRCRDQARA